MFWSGSGFFVLLDLLRFQDSCSCLLFRPENLVLPCFFDLMNISMIVCASSADTGTSPLLYLVDSVRASKHTEVGWPALHFRGCSVYHRRNELASCVDIIDVDGQPHVIFMCVWAGRYGRMTPLIVNRHHGSYVEALQIVIMLPENPWWELSMSQLPSEVLRSEPVVLIEFVMHNA